MALAIAACQHGVSIDFTTLDDLVQHLKTAEQRHQLQHTLQTYVQPALWVGDEVGYLRLDRAEANDLFQLLCRRYERGRVILLTFRTSLSDMSHF